MNLTKPFRLGLWTRDPQNARSLSRQFGPFNAMARQNPLLQISRAPVHPEDPHGPPDWDWVSGLDALYLLDPFTLKDARLASIARACGTALWVDYIDDLTNVPASNPVAPHYTNGEAVRNNMELLIAGAAVVTTTTYTLKCRLPHRDKIIVLPESCRWPACELPRQRVVSWRGGPSHEEDLASVLPQLSEVARLPQFSKWTWLFLGFDKPDWRLTNALGAERVKFEPWLPPYDFMNTWGSYAPWVHLAPLVDSAFNRAKTPLAWLEATAIGAAVIGPALPEWNTCPGLVRYQSPADFGDRLKETLFAYQPETGLHPAAQESRAAVYPARTLGAVNQLRWRILEQLAGTAQPETAQLASA